MIIQIAGVRDEKDLGIIIDSGATDIGFPLRLPVHKEDTTEQEARELILRIPKNIHKVLITYLNTAREILELSHYLAVDIVQLHGPVSVEEIKKIKLADPELKIIKSLVVEKSNLAELTKTIKELEQFVDFFITDTYDAKTGASGATGKTHDWNISKKIVELSTKPVILAGGLTPENVGLAIRTVKPAGVDVHTGVENDKGEKDAALVSKFVREAKKALIG
ncbi:MAG: phosphoribosylanthranilate isomerase [bacterium]